VGLPQPNQATDPASLGPSQHTNSCVCRSDAKRVQTVWRSSFMRAADLRFLVGAGEGNRTLMTSLEGVPHHAVRGADLAILMTGSGRC